MKMVSIIKLQFPTNFRSYSNGKTASTSYPLCLPHDLQGVAPYFICCPSLFYATNTTLPKPHWLPHCSFSLQSCFHLKDFALAKSYSPFYHFLNVFAYMSFWKRNIPWTLLLFTILFSSLFLHCTFLLDRLNTCMFTNMSPLVGYVTQVQDLDLFSRSCSSHYHLRTLNSTWPNIRCSVYLLGGFSGDSVGKNLPAIQEMWVPSLAQEDPLEKGMATHPNFLAWEISWIEKPGKLQSIRLQRVRHNWSDSVHIHPHIFFFISG